MNRVSIQLNDNALQVIRKGIESKEYSTQSELCLDLSIDPKCIKHIFEQRRMSYQMFNFLGRKLNISLELYEALELGARGLHERMTFLRTTSGVTQEEAGKVVFKSYSEYSKIEKGIKPITPLMISQLADFYGVSEDYLKNGVKEQ